MVNSPIEGQTNDKATNDDVYNSLLADRADCGGAGQYLFKLAITKEEWLQKVRAAAGAIGEGDIAQIEARAVSNVIAGRTERRISSRRWRRLLRLLIKKRAVESVGYFIR
jgi:hypothetical protein